MEARLLLLSMAAGAGLMAVYDVFRFLRLVLPHSWLMVGLEDVLYWIFAGFAVFYLLYRENDGGLRFYVVGTVFLAMVCYDRICSSFFLKLLKKIGRCFKIRSSKFRKQQREVGE